jgi:tetratricopeptide (TPR) repeat protein
MQARIIVYVLFISVLFFVIVPVVQAEDAIDWYIKGENAILVGDYTSAASYYDNAIALDQKYTAAYAGKAYALNQMGNFAGALDAADQALAIKNDARALKEKAYALFKLQRYDESVTAYDTFFAFQTNIAETYCNQGMAYDALNKKEEAIADYGRCASLDPKNLNAWNRKGLALLSLGRYQEALDAFNQCTQITIYNAEVWYNKGLAYGALGDYNNALVCFKRAISLDPTYSDAKQNLEKVYVRAPFFTPVITPMPKDTPKALTTPLPVTSGPIAEKIITSVSTSSSTETPTKVPTSPPATYAPLSPFGACSGIAIACIILSLNKYRN